MRTHKEPEANLKVIGGHSSAPPLGGTAAVFGLLLLCICEGSDAARPQRVQLLREIMMVVARCTQRPVRCAQKFVPLNIVRTFLWVMPVTEAPIMPVRTLQNGHMCTVRLNFAERITLTYAT